MRFTTSRLIGMATAATIVAVSPAMAQGKSGKGHDKGKKHERGDVVIIDSHGSVGKTPPGLAKKPGRMPPGQYKKRYTTLQGLNVMRDVFGRHGYTYVRTDPYENGRYVWYRTPTGRVERAIILPGTTQLTFSNVPSLIVQEVLARLY